jgi:hypothetical protein
LSQDFFSPLLFVLPQERIVEVAKLIIPSPLSCNKGLEGFKVGICNIGVEFKISFK